MNILFIPYFRPKKIPEETWSQIFISQDKDPEPDPQHWLAVVINYPITTLLVILFGDE
jgi:predicted metalloenzyme YecM